MEEIRLGGDDSCLIPLLSWKALVDLEGSRREACLEKIDCALQSNGFIIVRDTGLDGAAEKVRSRAEDFFSLPDSLKSAPPLLSLSDQDGTPAVNATPWGYKGFQIESSGAFTILPPDPSGPSDNRQYRDLKESFQTDNITRHSMEEKDLKHIRGTVFDMPCQWPSETDAPGFRKAVTDYYHESNRFSADVGLVLEEAVHTPAAEARWLSGAMRGPFSSTTKINSYSWVKGDSMEQDVMAAHLDATLLTLISLDGRDCNRGEGAKRLEIWDRHSRQWYAVPAMLGTYVVQMGGLGSMRSNGRWMPNWHRVSAPQHPQGGQQHSSSGSRMTLVTFMAGRLDAQATGPSFLVPGKDTFSLNFSGTFQKFRDMTLSDFIRDPSFQKQVDDFVSSAVEDAGEDALVLTTHAQ